MKSAMAIFGLLLCASTIADAPPPLPEQSPSDHVEKAFAPGHYLAPAPTDTLDSSHSTFWRYFDDTDDAFVGVWASISWRSIETAEDVMDFSTIENLISILKHYKPEGKLIVKLETRGFSYRDEDGDGIKDPPQPIVPDYIRNNPTKYANGGTYTCSPEQYRVMRSDLNLFDSDLTDRYIAVVTAIGRHFADDPTLVMIQSDETAVDDCHFQASSQAAASGMTEKEMRIAMFQGLVRAMKEVNYNLRNAPAVFAHGLNFLGWVTDHIPNAYETMCEAMFTSRGGGGGPNVKHGKRQPSADYCYQPSANGAEASRFVVGMRGDTNDNCGWGNAEQVWAKKIGHVATPPDTSSFNAQYPIWRRVTNTNQNYRCKNHDKGRYHIEEIVAAIRHLPSGWPAVEALRPINLRSEFVPIYEER